MMSQPQPSEVFNWDEIRQRLERLQQAFSQAEVLTAEQAEVVMAERARLLAQVPQEAPDTSEILELMILQLGSERVGLETRYIREVNRLTDATPIPGAPDFLIGVTNLRGQVLAVMELRSLLGITIEKSDDPPLIVLGTDRPEFGVIVDAVHEVTTLRIDEILPLPGSINGVARDYLRGVTEEALLIADGGVLLADERLYMDEAD